MAVAVCICFCLVLFSDLIAEAADTIGISMDYETELFNNDSIISINILIDDDDWNEMLQNAISEEYVQCDVEVNGTVFYNVGIRPKGNTSLTFIANDPTTDRYSFKLEFDHYVEGQSCFGLDKLVLNNNYADATNMKEALVYDMYRYLGVDASLCNYANISVNGEYWGIYLALEAPEDSFLLRNYGVQSGRLYKPEGVNIGGGVGKNRDFADMFAGAAASMKLPEIQGGSDDAGFPRKPDVEESGVQAAGIFGREPDFDRNGLSTRPYSDFDFPGVGSIFSISNGGADLNYTDDELDSYFAIWDGEITSSDKADHRRVIAALKNISEGKDLEDSMDIDNILRYMAVHVFAVNEDSLSGSMAHNYYLYEYGGRLNLLPWDYNLAFGGMSSGSNASNVVNSPIDNAFSITDFFDSLMADETYHSKYYEYMRQLVSEYINGGGFDTFYNRTRSLIDEAVKTDPTAFYTYEEYLDAADTLYQVVKLRAESVTGQLDGSIPSTESEQRESNALIDAADVNISAMGQMNTGGSEPGDQNMQDEGRAQDEKDSMLPANDIKEKPLMDDFQPNDRLNSSEKAFSSTASAYILSVAIFIAAMLFAVLYRRQPGKQ